MGTKRVGIIMNGVTGRMGRNQHLARSIAAIRASGGMLLGDDLIFPDPILVGRDKDRLQSLADAHDIERISTDLEACLAESDDTIYFDAQTTVRRSEALVMAMKAGKHIYCEKPVATSSRQAFELADLAEKLGVRNGVVEDKLFLPGLLKLARVLESGQLGQVLAVRIDFGYWVFPDETGARQRPSWNYRSEDGGGIVLDMFCHFNYLLSHLIAPVKAVVCQPVTHISERIDESGKAYPATADDAAYALLELEGGITAQINASWAVRPYRDDLFSMQVDGVNGSAVADLRECRLQPASATPCFTWNPDLPMDKQPRSGWMSVPDITAPENAFRRQWELFLSHVLVDTPFPWDIRDSARGVQLAECALRSAQERRWLEIQGEMH